MNFKYIVKASSACVLTLSIVSCAGSPARTLIDAKEKQKIYKAEVAADEQDILNGNKGGLVVSVKRNTFRGSVPCEYGTLFFVNIDTAEKSEVGFRRTGSGVVPRILALEEGRYRLSNGTCTFINNKTQYQTTYIKDVPFIVLGGEADSITVNSGEVVFPGTFNFNQVKESIFTLEYTENLKGIISRVEKRHPNLIDHFKFLPKT